MRSNYEYAIDFLKFFAALLITNSHLDIFEPQYKLSSGGAIGDALFFFCSGYTLFLGRMNGFCNWYKRRLIRIFPPVMCMGIISAFIFRTENSLNQVIIEGGGWFVQCILIYYLFAYPIKKYAINHLNIIAILTGTITVIWFYMICNQPGFGLYGWNYCKWVAFFLFFLQGAIICQQKKHTYKRLSFWNSLSGLLLSVITWYGCLIVQTKYDLTIALQLISLLPLMGISFFFFHLCRSIPMENLFTTKYIHQVIKSIGGLCFEIYLVQFTLFANIEINVEYPLNIGVIWCYIIIWAYILHVFTNFCIQTFREQDYNWKRMLKVY